MNKEMFGIDKETEKANRLQKINGLNLANMIFSIVTDINESNSLIDIFDKIDTKLKDRKEDDVKLAQIYEPSVSQQDMFVVKMQMLGITVAVALLAVKVLFF